jgi:glycosyltransferase involved in cell wall biosynthesis
MMVVPNGIDCAALGAAVLDTAGMDTLVHGTAGLARGASIARRKIREQLGVDEKSFLWLAAGRLMPAKDYPTLISAFFQHRRKHPDSFLAIAGEGPLREDLDAQVRREFEESNPGGEANSNKKRPSPIRFLGLRQDLPSVMVASDAFALSSAWEGFGLVLAEALYLGLPAAATDSGGVGDIFAAAGGSAASGSAAGGNADPLLRLCPIKDAPALAASMDAIREALAAGVDAAATAGGSDCGSRGDPRKAGRSRGIEKTFGIESILDRWEKIYQSAPAMVY